MDHARFGTLSAQGLAEVRDSLDDLTPGWWGVVVTFEGAITALRFETVSEAPLPVGHSPWSGLTGAWHSSMGRAAYEDGVAEIRDRIAAGTVYQVNLCRVLSHPVSQWPDLAALAAVLERGNPAPYSGLVDARGVGVGVVCASPELYLSIDRRRVVSGPIKGTAVTVDGLLPKDFSENVMIVDLVRNDLSHVCEPGTVEVEALCALEQHPGLVHLTSYVAGRLREDVGWSDVLAATFPPGSVTGAPKSSALQTIGELEGEARDAYCGAIGWIDTRDPDRLRAELAVGIRSFFVRDGPGVGTGAEGSAGLEVCFGTGAGITWDSEPGYEWAETELKAARLIALASAGEAPRQHLVDLEG